MRPLGERIGSKGPRGFESHPLRQLEKEVAGSPSLPVRQAGARARQPILGAKLIFCLWYACETPEAIFYYFIFVLLDFNFSDIII